MDGRSVIEDREIIISVRLSGSGVEKRREKHEKNYFFGSSANKKPRRLPGGV